MEALGGHADILKQRTYFFGSDTCKEEHDKENWNIRRAGNTFIFERIS